MFKALSTLLFLVFVFGTVLSQGEETKCSELTVFGPPATIQQGKTVGFKAELTPPLDPSKYEAKWSVEGGKIVSGQGTLEIEVEHPGRGMHLVANVEISGLGECNRIGGDTYIDESGSVMPVLIDEFGELPDDELQVRIKKLVLDLDSDPTATGFIRGQIILPLVVPRGKTIEQRLSDKA